MSRSRRWWGACLVTRAAAGSATSVRVSLPVQLPFGQNRFYSPEVMALRLSSRQKANPVASGDMSQSQSYEYTQTAKSEPRASDDPTPGQLRCRMRGHPTVMMELYREPRGSH